ncbi:hypothetical protein ACQ4PT_044589 [Festuca glaucescens]
MCYSTAADFEHLNGTALHLPLHHLSDLPFSAVLTHDAARIASFAARLAKTPSSSEAHPIITTSATSLYHPDSSLASVPLTPGSSFGMGNYVTRMSGEAWVHYHTSLSDHRTASAVGLVVADDALIASSPVFDPKTSSSYSSVPCSTPQCTDLSTATLNPAACSSSDVCIYQASYGDSSRVSSAAPRGSWASPATKLSLLYQLAPTLGYSFSYCLPSSSSSGYLSIGSYNPGQYSYTPMVASTLDDSLYFIKLTGMTVAGKPLSVSSSEYSSLPTIIDSGTVITRLPTSIYTALSKAVAGAMKGTKHADAYSILDTCFVGQASQLRAPAVTMDFAGDASLKLKAQNLLVDVDSSTTAAIIGNTQQQSFSVVYDVKSNKIGFAAGGCK